MYKYSMNMTSENMRKHYDVDVPQKSGMAYEYDRWFRSAEARAGYEMTKKSIEKELRTISPKRCFELGPGAGTWTELLCTHFPEASIDALDISEHMLAMARKKLEGKCPGISFIHTDFLKFKPDKQYDLFFSSRVFEYFEDKGRATKKITELLKGGGRGMLITKYPRYIGFKLRGISVTDMHKSQIAPDEIKKLFENNGLRIGSIRPVVLTFPLFRSAFLHKLIYALIGNFEFSSIHKPFCESYAVYFEKHDN